MPIRVFYLKSLKFLLLSNRLPPFVSPPLCYATAFLSPFLPAHMYVICLFVEVTRGVLRINCFMHEYFIPTKALALSCLFFCIFCTSLLRPLLCVFTFSSNQCLASYRGLWPVEATVSCRPPCYEKSKWSDGIPNRCWEAKSRRQTSEAAEMKIITIKKKKHTYVKDPDSVTCLCSRNCFNAFLWSHEKVLQ